MDSEDRQRRTGLNALITGATSGLGRRVAFELGPRCARLLLTGRNQAAGERVAQCLRRRYGVAAEFLAADLLSGRQVRELAARVRDRVSHLDVLVNNAGARFEAFAANEDGIERTFALNHLGHFLLTALLLDRLTASPAAQVLVVGSRVHRSVREPVAWLATEATYKRREAYARSKLANVVFAYELARRMEATSVKVNVFDPGLPLTRFGRNNGWSAWLKHVLYHGLRGQLCLARTSARHLVDLAMPRESAGLTGGYFVEGRKVESSDLSHSSELARDLWALSVRLTGLDAGMGEGWDYCC